MPADDHNVFLPRFIERYPDMSKNEKSSKELASLAGKVLQQKSTTEAAKKLAGSVLTQAPDRKTGGGKKGGK